MRTRLVENPRGYLESLEPPVLIDEWQEEPAAWDGARRSVDAEWVPGRYLLTGSVDPRDVRVHTGAGRFISLRMRPLAFAERYPGAAAISLGKILASSPGVPPLPIEGSSTVTLEQYLAETLRSGFPAIWSAPEGIRARLLDAYLEQSITHEVTALGTAQRRPESLTEWLRAYAAATSTTASFTSIASAVAADAHPARSTVVDYRDALARLWLLDEVPAWSPGGTSLGRLGRTAKHHIADPALAARLLNVDLDSLFAGRTSPETAPQYQRLIDGLFAGNLFESLVTLSIRVYAQRSPYRIAHLRTHNGQHEVDLILYAPDGRVVAIEVKLNPVVGEREVRHLGWLQERLGDQLIDRIVITTGPSAYRRRDGVAVIPLALLGP